MKRIFLPVLLLLSTLLHAQIPNPQKGTYVNDFAHVLTKSEIAALNKKIFLIEKKTSVQLAVVLVKKIPAAYDIQDYALLIGRKWHVGKDRNGLVYVASILQHKQRIEVARRLDSVMTHERCMAIMADIKPYFRQKDYGSGLQVLVSGIDSTLAPQDLRSVATAAPAASAKSTDTSDSTASVLVGAVVVILIIVLIVYLVKRSSRTVYTNTNTGGQYINNSGYNANNSGYNANNGGYNANYGNGGSSNHTVRDMATGAILGAAAGYAVRGIEDKLDNLGNHNSRYNSGYSSDYNSVSDNDSSSNTDDNNSSNWGNWGSDSGTDSSSSSSDDSGFSDSGSDDSGGSSDW
jgi:uncharacterized membrane protein YgcG